MITTQADETMETEKRAIKPLLAAKIPQIL